MTGQRQLEKDEVLERELLIGKRKATAIKPYRFVIFLANGQSVRDLSRTGASLYGPAVVEYSVYGDGGVDVVLKTRKS